MRTLLCAIPALLALAGTALAEPQQLDEAQLGGIAAGEAAGFDLSTYQSDITIGTSNTMNRSEQILDQSLQGMSANTVYSTGVGSTDVHAMGSAITDVVGNLP